ncbi:MAG: hypothetical protein JWO62_3797 [Acidimicrobiaceae bacterium]|nr:hypothetical protein [Acidimicrobiaceae bacterium]
MSDPEPDGARRWTDAPAVGRVPLDRVDARPATGAASGATLADLVSANASRATDAVGSMKLGRTTARGVTTAGNARSGAASGAADVAGPERRLRATSDCAGDRTALRCTGAGATRPAGLTGLEVAAIEVAGVERSGAATVAQGHADGAGRATSSAGRRPICRAPIADNSCTGAAGSAGGSGSSAAAASAATSVVGVIGRAPSNGVLSDAGATSSTGTATGTGPWRKEARRSKRGGRGEDAGG